MGLFDYLRWRLSPNRQQTIEVEFSEHTDEMVWANLYLVRYVGGLAPNEEIYRQHISKTLARKDEISDTQANIALHRINSGKELP